MEKAASGRARGSTGPVKYTNGISEIGEGALTRWSAEICCSGFRLAYQYGWRSFLFYQASHTRVLPREGFLAASI